VEKNRRGGLRRQDNWGGGGGQKDEGRGIACEGGGFCFCTFVSSGRESSN